MCVFRLCVASSKMQCLGSVIEVVALIRVKQALHLAKISVMVVIYLLDSWLGDGLLWDAQRTAEDTQHLVWAWYECAAPPPKPREGHARRASEFTQPRASEDRKYGCVPKKVDWHDLSAGTQCQLDKTFSLTSEKLLFVAGDKEELSNPPDVQYSGLSTLKPFRERTARRVDHTKYPNNVLD